MYLERYNLRALAPKVRPRKGRISDVKTAAAEHISRNKGQRMLFRYYTYWPNIAYWPNIPVKIHTLNNLHAYILSAEDAVLHYRRRMVSLRLFKFSFWAISSSLEGGALLSDCNSGSGRPRHSEGLTCHNKNNNAP